MRSNAIAAGAPAPASRKRTSPRASACVAWGGEGLILDRNLFRTSSVPGITEEIARSSVYDYAERELGVTIATSKRAITVERATARDRELLDLGDIDYLAVITSQTFDARGILIECTQSRHRPDHFCFRDTAVRHHV